MSISPRLPVSAVGKTALMDRYVDDFWMDRRMLGALHNVCCTAFLVVVSKRVRLGNDTQWQKSYLFTDTVPADADHAQDYPD